MTILSVIENAVILALELNSYSTTSESKHEEMVHAVINKLAMIFKTLNFMFVDGSFISRCKSRKFFLSTEVLKQVLYLFIDKISLFICYSVGFLCSGPLFMTCLMSFPNIFWLKQVCSEERTGDLIPS